MKIELEIEDPKETVVQLLEAWQGAARDGCYTDIKYIREIALQLFDGSTPTTEIFPNYLISRHQKMTLAEYIDDVEKE